MEIKEYISGDTQCYDVAKRVHFPATRYGRPINAKANILLTDRRIINVYFLTESEADCIRTLYPEAQRIVKYIYYSTLGRHISSIFGGESIRRGNTKYQELGNCYVYTEQRVSAFAFMSIKTIIFKSLTY